MLYHIRLINQNLTTNGFIVDYLGGGGLKVSLKDFMSYMAHCNEGGGVY